MPPACKSYLYMDAMGGMVWVDGWMDGWMGGWMSGWMDEWMDGWMDGWMGGITNRCMSE